MSKAKRIINTAGGLALAYASTAIGTQLFNVALLLSFTWRWAGAVVWLFFGALLFTGFGLVAVVLSLRYLLRRYPFEK